MDIVLQCPDDLKDHISRTGVIPSCGSLVIISKEVQYLINGIIQAIVGDDLVVQINAKNIKEHQLELSGTNPELLLERKPVEYSKIHNFPRLVSDIPVE